MRLARMAAAPLPQCAPEQRLAADGGRRRRGRQRARSAPRAMPPDACHCRSAESGCAPPGRAPRSGPASAPSRSMSVHSTCRSPPAAKAATASQRRQRGGLLPAAGAAGAGRPRHRCARRRPGTAARRRSARSQRRTASGRSTAALPMTTRATPSCSRASITAAPHAATDLELQRRCAASRSPAFDECMISLGTVAGAVQVDDVQPARAQRAVAPQQRARIERHSGSRWRSRHAAAARTGPPRRSMEGIRSTACDRKLRSTRAPALDERSGWNCTPLKLSRRTTARRATGHSRPRPASPRRPGAA